MHVSSQQWVEWNQDKDSLLLQVAGERARPEGDSGNDSGRTRSPGAAAATEIPGGGEAGSGREEVDVEDEVAVHGDWCPVFSVWNGCVATGAGGLGGGGGGGGGGRGQVEQVVTRFLSPLPHGLQGLLSCL